MRLVRFVLLIVAGHALVARAQPVSGTWTASASVASQYLFRGLRYGGPSLQPMIEYDRGALVAGVWASTPLAHKVPGQSDPEIDPFASYRIAVNDTVSLQPGATLYVFPRAERDHGFHRVTFEPSLTLNYTTHGVTFSPKLYYDVVLRGPTYELNAAYALPLRAIGSELDFYASVGAYDWDDAVADAAPRTRAHGDYWNVTVALPFQISRRAKITASVGCAEGWNARLEPAGAASRHNPLAARRAFVTLGYAMTF